MVRRAASPSTAPRRRLVDQRAHGVGAGDEIGQVGRSLAGLDDGHDLGQPQFLQGCQGVVQAGSEPGDLELGEGNHHGRLVSSCDERVRLRQDRGHDRGDVLVAAPGGDCGQVGSAADAGLGQPGGLGAGGGQDRGRPLPRHLRRLRLGLGDEVIRLHLS